MTDKIEVQVSAPGAANAAKEMELAANAAFKLAEADLRVASDAAKVAANTTKVTAAVKMSAAEFKAAAAAVNHYTAEMTAAGVKLRPVTDELIRARNESRKLREEHGAGGGGHGEHGQGAAYWMSRAAPGHEMQIMNAASAGGAGAIPLIGGLIAALGVFKIALEVGNETVRQHNELAMENLKREQTMSRQAVDLQRERDANAATDLKSIRKSARFILNSDDTGEATIKELQRSGAGLEGVNAMSGLLKHRGHRFGSMTASGILEEAKAVSEETGMDLTETISAMGSSQGRYSRSRFEREQMGKTFSPEMRKMFKEKGDRSETGQLLDVADREVRDENRHQLGDALGGLATSGLARQLRDLVDPMAKIIEEHNRKVREEIEVREEMINAERGILEFWASTLDPSGKLLGSDKAKAAFEKRKLTSTLR